MSSSKHSARQHFWEETGSFVENAITNNIVLAQGIGLCPIIAAGVTLKNGVALTVCTAIVMLPLSLLIPLFGSRIPKWLRPALYVVLASLLLVGAAFGLQHYISSELYARLYLYIPLLAVNMLYYRNTGIIGVSSVFNTIVDSLGSTVGFGLVICLISALREMAIYDTLWDVPLGYTVDLPEAASPFAAFILLGFLAATLQWSRRRISAYFHKKEEQSS